MADADPWPMIHAERAALIADLESLEPSRWETPSQCAGWTVRDVLAHMTATARMTPPKFFSKFVSSGFRFNAMAQKDVEAERGSSGADALQRFRSQANSTTHPPGPIDAMLGEAVLHGEDIRRPLGISHTYPMAVVTRCADFYKGSNLLIGTKKRIDGLTLKATDTDWSNGSGPEVTGPMLALLLAMTGRAGALLELYGPGVTTLRSRA